MKVNNVFDPVTEATDSLRRAASIGEAANGRTLTRAQHADLADAATRCRAARLQIAPPANPDGERYFYDLGSKRNDAFVRAQAVMDRAAGDGRDIDAEENHELQRAADTIDDLNLEIRKMTSYRARMAPSEAARAHLMPALRDMRDGGISTTSDPVAYLFGAHEQRATLTSTSTSALATRQDWGPVWNALADESVAIRSGIRIEQISETTIHMARGTALATGGWLAAGGTATASDGGYAGTDVTPARLGLLSEFSRELFEDRERFEQQAGGQMIRSLAIKLDQTIYEGQASGATPQGMLNLAGSGTATTVAGVSDLTRFAASQEAAYKAGSKVGAWVFNGDVWGQLAAIKIGGSSDVRPLLQADTNAGGAAIATSILGAPAYVTGGTQIIATTGGTVSTGYGYDPAQVVLVVRRDYEMVVDPYSKAEQGIVRCYLEGRFGIFFPQPGAIQVIPINNLT